MRVRVWVFMCVRAGVRAALFCGLSIGDVWRPYANICGVCVCAAGSASRRFNWPKNKALYTHTRQCCFRSSVIYMVRDKSDSDDIDTNTSWPRCQRQKTPSAPALSIKILASCLRLRQASSTKHCQLKPPSIRSDGRAIMLQELFAVRPLPAARKRAAQRRARL